MEQKLELPKIGGYYYHYKHDPNGTVNNYAYVIIGIGHHTEMKDTPEALMVVYKPLYDTAHVYEAGKYFDIRPLHGVDPEGKYFGFMDLAEYNGETVVRFTKITDMEVLAQLKEIEAKMYA